jgi:hypothetical protein
MSLSEDAAVIAFGLAWSDCWKAWICTLFQVLLMLTKLPDPTWVRLSSPTFMSLKPPSRFCVDTLTFADSLAEALVVAEVLAGLVDEEEGFVVEFGLGVVGLGVFGLGAVAFGVVAFGVAFGLVG